MLININEDSKRSLSRFVDSCVLVIQVSSKFIDTESLLEKGYTW